MRHEIGHERGIGGGQRALVIVDANGIGDVLRACRPRRSEIWDEVIPEWSCCDSWHLIAEGFHGQMQHHLVAAAVGFFRDLAGVGVMRGGRKESEGKGGRKTESAAERSVPKSSRMMARRGAPARAADEGCGVACPLSRVARFGAEIAGRFGIVASRRGKQIEASRRNLGRAEGLSAHAAKKKDHERTKRLSSPELFSSSRALRRTGSSEERGRGPSGGSLGVLGR